MGREVCASGESAWWAKRGARPAFWGLPKRQSAFQGGVLRSTPSCRRGFVPFSRWVFVSAWSRQGARLLVALGALSISGCDQDVRALVPEKGPTLLHSTMASTAYGVAATKWSHVPVPPEEGPKLAPVSLITPILEAPVKGSTPIGYLRVGEKVSRSEEPVSTAGCPGGWYAVRPVGFVCQDHNATLRMDHPLVRAFTHGPDVSKPLPYEYGFIRSVAPNYLRIPTKEEQFKFEMRLERHLRNYEKLADKWDVMVPGANDVPLNERGAAVGPIPEDTPIPGYNERYGGSGDDSIPWWLQGERRIPNISSFKAPGYAVIADRIKRHAGVALVESFVTGEDSNNRRFAVAVDGRIIPADKIKADNASAFHGEELGDTPLPVAFPWRPGTRLWQLERGVERLDEVPLRKMIPLSGKVKMSRGERFVETTDGKWLRSKDLKVAPQPSELPWFAKNGVRWIDISILSQTLVLYEGSKPVYVTLVSTGRDGMGDPNKTLSTPTGTFRIYQKHVTTTMDSSVADNEFELRDVPWVMYFKGGYAIHAAYWHDDFGRLRSHGCVNLSPIDARYVFNFVSPDVPDHWHASYSGDALGQGTLVHIHG